MVCTERLHMQMWQTACSSLCLRQSAPAWAGLELRAPASAHQPVQASARLPSIPPSLSLSPFSLPPLLCPACRNFICPSTEKCPLGRICDVLLLLVLTLEAAPDSLLSSSHPRKTCVDRAQSSLQFYWKGNSQTVGKRNIATFLKRAVC